MESLRYATNPISVYRFHSLTGLPMSLPPAAVRNHLDNLVKEYRKVPGLKEKTFFMNPQNLDQGACLIWESQELFDQYLKSDLYKSAVTDICEGQPRWETYPVTATIKDGVLI